MATPSPAPNWRSERATLAALARRRPADDPDLLAARRRLRAVRAAEYLRDVVAAEPPLTAEQRRELAAILAADEAVAA